LRRDAGASLSITIAALPVEERPFSAAAQLRRQAENGREKDTRKMASPDWELSSQMESFGPLISRGFESSAANVMP